MSDGERGRRRLDELDALRGIGAIAVVIYHYTTRFHEKFPDAGHVPFDFIGGDYRVLLFFAISGFAIFFTLDRIRDAADFVANRAVRLFPAYWTAMLLTLAVEHLGHVTSLYVPTVAVIANISMLEGFVFLPAVDGAYWTLTVEIGFYVSIMLLWLVRGKHGAGEGTGIRRLEPALAGWLGIKWLLFFWPDMPERIVMLLVLRYVPFFIIGMLSYRIWTGQRTWREQAPYFALVLLTIGVIETPDLLAAGGLLVLCFWAMLRGYLRFLCVAPLLWLGGISYSLYLVHENIGFVIMLKASAMGFDPWVGFITALAVALGLGVLLNRTVERPAARWLSARWKRWRARRPANDDMARQPLSEEVKAP